MNHACFICFFLLMIIDHLSPEGQETTPTHHYKITLEKKVVFSFIISTALTNRNRPIPRHFQYIIFWNRASVMFQSAS